MVLRRQFSGQPECQDEKYQGLDGRTRGALPARILAIDGCPAAVGLIALAGERRRRRNRPLAYGGGTRSAGELSAGRHGLLRSRDRIPDISGHRFCSSASLRPWPGPFPAPGFFQDFPEQGRRRSSSSSGRAFNSMMADLLLALAAMVRVSQFAS